MWRTSKKNTTSSEHSGLGDHKCTSQYYSVLIATMIVTPLSCAFSDNLIPGTFTRPIFADVLGPILALTGAPVRPGPTHESTFAVLEVLCNDSVRDPTFVNIMSFRDHKQVPVLY